MGGAAPDGKRRRAWHGASRKRPGARRSSARTSVRAGESQTMKTGAVLGGGPAGASAAERLARAGLNTVVFDEKLAWEKPCGGGVIFEGHAQYSLTLGT